MGIYLVRSLNAGYVVGKPSLTPRQGTIILVPKVVKSKDIIDNWRPISFSNTTQKNIVGGSGSTLAESNE